MVPAPELQIQNNFWRINANQSVVTSVILQVFTNASGTVVNKFYQIVVQVSCTNSAGAVYTCSFGRGTVSLPTNTAGATFIVTVPLTPQIDPETTEIDDLSYIVTGYVLPSSTPGVISLTANGNPTLNSNGTGTLQATLMSINGFTGTVELTALPAVQDPGVDVSLSPQPYPPVPSENVTLTADGSVHVTLSVDAANAGPGNYLVVTSLSCVSCPSGSVVLYSPNWWVNVPSIDCLLVPFTITANPTFVLLATTGGVETVLKTVTSRCGFTGYITLSATVSPSGGPTVSIPSGPIYLPPDGAFNVTETITSASTSSTGIAAPGTYIIVNTATSGTVSASTTVTVKVYTL
jgi:hypothetical protein